MKKKFLLGLLVLVGLFTITGCGSSTEETTKGNKNEVTIVGVKYSLTDSENFHGMKFKYEKDAKNFKIKDSTKDNNMALIYLQDDSDEDLFRIALGYYKDSTVSEKLLDWCDGSNKVSYNNLKWTSCYNDTTYYDAIVDMYLYQNGNDTYVISFSTKKYLNFNMNDYVKLFMTNVSFK